MSDKLDKEDQSEGLDLIEGTESDFEEDEDLDLDLDLHSDEQTIYEYEDDGSRTVFVPEEAPKVEPAMIVRTIVLVVAIINAAFAMFGSTFEIEVDQAAIYEVVSWLFLLGSGVWSWFKDNDVSKKARKRKEISRQVEDD